jgi:hypothetical protein
MRTHLAATLLTVELHAERTQQLLSVGRLAMSERVGAAGLCEVDRRVTLLGSLPEHRRASNSYGRDLKDS